MIAAESRVPLIINAYEGYSFVSYLITGDGARSVSWANFMAADSGSKGEWVRRAARVVAIAGLVLVAWVLDWTLVPLLRRNDQRRVMLGNQWIERDRRNAPRVEREADLLCDVALGQARQEIWTQLQTLAQQDTVTLYDLRKFEAELSRAERLLPFKKLVVGFKYYPKAKPEDLEFIMRIAPRLSHVDELVLHLNGETFALVPALTIAFPKVQRLQVHFDHTVGDKLTSGLLVSACSMIGQRFSGLQSFCLTTNERNLDDAVEELAKYAKHLTSLNLSELNLTERGLKSIEKFAFLERLRFSAYEIESGHDAEVMSVVRACRRLRHLEVFWSRLKQEAFSDILYYLPKLETLSLKYLLRSKFEIGAHIRHEHLRELNLYSFSYKCEISFADLVTYAERAPALRKVILRQGWIRLTEAEQALLQSRFPRLELVIKD